MTQRQGGRRSIWLAGAAAALLVPAAGAGQQVAARDTVDPSLEVFLECHRSWGACDQRFFREEVTYVNWMRDRQDADVHIIITSLDTGGGGDEYTLEFIGRGPYAGQDRTLTYVSDANDTRDENRRGLLRTIELGLVPYLLQTAVAESLELVYAPPTEAERPGQVITPAEDPWNGWVFRVSVGGSANGESRERQYSYNGRFSGNRTTDLWRIGFYAHGSSQHAEFDVPIDETTDTTYIRDQDTYRTSAWAAYSLADHWSTGVRAAASAASFYNRDLVLEIGPALEYSVFPYAEASRRQLVLIYRVTGSHIQYEEETIYLKERETVLQESLELSYNATQPWGNAGFSIEGSHYFHRPADTWLYSGRIRGGMSLRIVRGLDLNFHGSVGVIRDQLYIPAAGSTLDDILLQRRQLETDYEYGVHMSLSYRFGSKFNNIVNPRLDEAF